jgi:hypothetical protein
MTDRLYCSHCHDVIGVYEPLIAIVDGGALEASRASRPDIGSRAVAYHRDCFAHVRQPSGSAVDAAPAATD